MEPRPLAVSAIAGDVHEGRPSAVPRPFCGRCSTPATPSTHSWRARHLGRIDLAPQQDVHRFVISASSGDHSLARAIGIVEHGSPHQNSHGSAAPRLARRQSGGDCPGRSAYGDERCRARGTARFPDASPHTLERQAPDQLSRPDRDAMRVCATARQCAVDSGSRRQHRERQSPQRSATHGHEPPGVLHDRRAIQRAGDGTSRQYGYAA